MLIYSTSFKIYSDSFNSNLCHFCIFSLYISVVVQCKQRVILKSLCFCHVDQNFLIILPSIHRRLLADPTKHLARENYAATLVPCLSPLSW